MQRHRAFRIGAFGAALALAAFAAGCASKMPPMKDSSHPIIEGQPNVPPPRDTKPLESGFLSDYRRLEPVAQYPDLRIYRDTAHRTAFRKVLFHPVEVWRSSERRLEDVPEDDLQYLADALYRSVHTRLEDSFRLVKKPGPGVLEIRLAFTLVTTSPSPVDYFSADVPVEKLELRRGALNPDTRRFLRSCALEAEFAETTSAAVRARAGKSGLPAARVVRAAVFDTRRGAESSKGTVETWEDVRAVFARWGELIDERLVRQRAA